MLLIEIEIINFEFYAHIKKLSLPEQTFECLMFKDCFFIQVFSINFLNKMKMLIFIN